MDAGKPNITFVIHTLECGGAERMITSLSAELASRGYAVTLVTLSAYKSHDFYPVSPGVKRIHAPQRISQDCRFFNLVGQYKKYKLLRETLLLTKPDVIISFTYLTSVLVLLSMIFSSVPIIISERSDPKNKIISSRFRFLRNKFYPLANCLVVQFQDLKEWCRSQWPNLRVTVISNPVFPTTLDSNSVKPILYQATCNLLSVGRLTHEKQHELLIHVFKEISPSVPDWQLTILGDGELKEDLLKLIDNHPKINLPGRVANPYPYMQHADLYVMTSKYEGFPNALAEAMACGLPPISFACPSAIPEIIRDGIDGVLVPHNDINALCEALLRYMRDKEARLKLAQKAPEITTRFDVNKITDQWERLIIETIGNN
jgi:GalNAc-alpha-(1->4)-GalNAc-alpha-(1->3)-diNAcBac-PP-undecaprenol alpha-1,4-N-acetyl-D-galactosaminyltransferase